MSLKSNLTFIKTVAVGLIKLRTARRDGVKLFNKLHGQKALKSAAKMVVFILLVPFLGKWYAPTPLSVSLM